MLITDLFGKVELWKQPNVQYNQMSNYWQKLCEHNATTEEKVEEDQSSYQKKSMIKM